MNEEIKISVKKILTDYLEKKNLRKTTERFAILDEVYSFTEHFDVEHFYKHMRNKKFKVSRATVYNTIELLIECNLVMKHQFGKNLALYEKSFGYKQHDHLICEDCEHVFEFCDPRIQQIQSMMGDILKFNITHHSLHLFGKCRELTASGKCRNKK
jgi:Fur family ferric uptake transcriptional regulator